MPPSRRRHHARQLLAGAQKSFVSRDQARASMLLVHQRHARLRFSKRIAQPKDADGISAFPHAADTTAAKLCWCRGRPQGALRRASARSTSATVLGFMCLMGACATAANLSQPHNVQLSAGRRPAEARNSVQQCVWHADPHRIREHSREGDEESERMWSMQSQPRQLITF